MQRREQDFDELPSLFGAVPGCLMTHYGLRIGVSRLLCGEHRCKNEMSGNYPLVRQDESKCVGRERAVLSEGSTRDCCGFPVMDTRMPTVCRGWSPVMDTRAPTVSREWSPVMDTRAPTVCREWSPVTDTRAPTVCWEWSPVMDSRALIVCREYSPVTDTRASTVCREWSSVTDTRVPTVCRECAGILGSICEQTVYSLCHL